VPTDLAPGIHLVHKPRGDGSKATLDAFRAPGGPRLCHGGALDPFAEGLLLVLAGDATRLFPWLHGIPKTYLAEVRWGRETDTGDPSGQPVAEGPTDTLAPARMDEVLAAHLGWQLQHPPATSNRRVDGERAWVRARRGETVELAPSRVLVHTARFTRHDLPRRSELELTVSGGTYVRALARDLGRALGTRAHLGRLRRTAVGPWLDPGPGRRVAVRGEALLPWCPTRVLDASERGRLGQGAPLPRGEVLPAPWPLPDAFPAPPVRLLHEGRLVGLAPDGDPLVSVLRLARGL